MGHMKPETKQAATSAITDDNLHILPTTRNKTPATRGTWATTKDPNAPATWTSYGYAIATGANPGATPIVVIDIDTPTPNLPPLPPTRTVTTPRGGRHLYYKLPPNTHIRTITNWLPSVDLRGEGGYAIGPGTPGYTSNGHPITAAPSHLLARLPRANTARARTKKLPPTTYNPTRATHGQTLARARYLALQEPHTAPHAVAGFVAAGQITKDEAESILGHPLPPGNHPPRPHIVYPRR